MAEEEKVLFICTHASDAPETAAIPFVMANGALAMDVQATIVLQGNGVYLVKKGYAEHMVKPGGFPPFAKLISDFQELGGKIMVCAPCIKERNIPESDLIAGAETTAAARLIIEALAAKAVFTY